MLPTASQQGTRQAFDVLIMGSGLAGLSFCLELSQLRPQTRIALISKTALGDSNSYYAQGGIAAVMDSKNDSLQQHIADTLTAGDAISYPPAVDAIIAQAPQLVQHLCDYGVPFDKVADQYHLTQEGGHSQRRIFHCGDQTGQAVIDTLVARVRQHANITLLESHMGVNLMLQQYPHQPGRQDEVIGAYVLDIQSGLIHTVLANTVVLATGGAGKIYRYTTNPDIATGDGLAMAYRAGARVGNLEFYQFHPTLLYHPECRNFLVSEAVRGEGGYLRLPDSGERFMQRYAPEQMELATRDIVARAIFNEMEQGDYSYVHLDITHRPKEFLQQRFPNIYRTLFKLGIDISRDPIPVVPAAHYQCGGVLSDIKGRTDKQRLYAIGEVAFTGLHGANRLASNSLVEAGVMGQLAAQDCLQWLEQPAQLIHQPEDWHSESVTDLRRASQINAHWRSLRGEMTSYAGIVRTEAGLEDLLKLIITRRDMVEEYYWKHYITRDLLELRNIILVAELIVRAALKRRESRGGHYREDYPQKSPHALETITQLAQTSLSVDLKD
jgi:L-aspartate oxidase